MRFIARYAKDRGRVFEIVTLYDEEMKIERVDRKKPIIKTLSHEHPAALWFERKIQDDFGIIVEDAFDKRPLVHQEQFPKNLHPMCKDFDKQELEFSEFQPYDYEVISGDGVFQVSVGPIHAGIIEPGHFHFSQAGEKMLHQEVRHFYKYRAVEKMLEGKTLLEAKSIIERISGNESIAYQMCWRDILLHSSQQKLPQALQKRHAFLLELERIIHHLTDLGFIPNDAGFGAALSFGSKLAEDARRKMKEITGHRFGFGGIDFVNKFVDTASLHEWLDSMQESIEYFEDWIIDIPSLWDRLDTTGVLPLKKAVKYDSVGVAARASGLAVDRRVNEFYLKHGFELASELSGDVGARFKVRIAEVKNSLKMMHNFLEEDETVLEPEAVKDGEYMSFTESSIGELFMAVDIKDGVIERFFVRDASFMNWQVLHVMMRNDIIADFPLINKSCDLSYAGNDL
ncbi:NADH-quinone oxidoreductase subunit C [Sulfurimonas autotrophica]|uniref:NADH dehydrogenase (Ubiquinone) 30 kDa subunit n=1 Tax=Sulfurimonas autotrophica (strain ATCC BAA-671 / DSM 16294 / JCM 11897 / OK10) TaxID=563040 RepID=E0URR7_SULAO|nr:NADH-quinone oxidoreductase subunit C [Sulfurimonas autotrophica]ADN10081.1 NADH dehydrogenase (ubiquinone) 30 kDa subunit [Sulfurimonas autotrophica DSM 16294]